MSLILASQSPRRSELLGLLNIPFRVEVADLDESPVPGESAETMTRRLAVAKAKHIYARGDLANWVLGGDTTVVLKDQILGKPVDRYQAIAMLNHLSGKTHNVITAVALVGKNYFGDEVSITKVRFCDISPRQIEDYCDSGEPFDKAGAYGIQGYAGSFIQDLSGSYSGVVGLPLYQTRLLLEQAGLLT